MTDVDGTAERTPRSGALCAEAQADGVPCTDAGRDCEICERAAAEWARQGGFAHPALVKEPESPDA